MGRSWNYEKPKVKKERLSMSLNKVILIGRLGKDVELSYTPAQKGIAKFSIATSEKRNDREITTWHNIVVWGKLAENCKRYLSKGKECYLEGSISHNSWTSSDGTKRTTTEINAQVVQFLSYNENESPIDNIPV